MNDNIFNVKAIGSEENERYEFSIKNKYKGLIHIFKYFDLEKFRSIALLQYHSITYYAIGWCRDSNFQCTIDCKEYTVDQDSLYLGCPGQRYKFVSHGISSDAFFVCFDAMVLKQMNKFIPEELLLKIFMLYSIKIKDESIKEELSSLFLKMAHEQENHYQEEDHTAYMCALLEQVLLILLRQIKDIEIPDNLENRQSLLYMKFTMKVNLYFNEKHKVSSYTKMLGVTSKTLRLCTKKFAGKSPKDIINERIAEEIPVIIKILKENNVKVTKTAIGAALGFKELPHFLNFCKNMNLNIDIDDA